MPKHIQRRTTRQRLKLAAARPPPYHRRMTDLTIILGNKNYSSWSLRAWLALEATGAGI